MGGLGRWETELEMREANEWGERNRTPRAGIFMPRRIRRRSVQVRVWQFFGLVSAGLVIWTLLVLAGVE